MLYIDQILAEGIAYFFMIFAILAIALNEISEHFLKED